MAGIEWNEGSAGSNGGTELMARELERRMPPDLMERFQIIPSQFRSADPTKIRILWHHLLPTDPESSCLADGGWRRFHRIVFVSNWQAQSFIHHFGIPWSRCVVMPNAIRPITVEDGRFDPVPADQPIRLVYTSTPQRGLNILGSVFDRICTERDDVELDIFSSFRLYGWEDGPWEALFDALRRNPKINYHGAVPNEQLRSALRDAHVFAYPSIYRECCSVAFIEAMSAGLACVHPNYGGLYETAAGWTIMYQWQDGESTHAAVFYQAVTAAIDALRAGDQRLLSRLAAQKKYADAFYNWDVRTAQWEMFLRSIADLPTT